MGAINVKLGVLGVSRWKLGFNASNYKITTSQVWNRLHDLPLEYCNERNVFKIARGVGMPFKIDPLTLILYHRMYARVLLDVDFYQALPKNPSKNGRYRK